MQILKVRGTEQTVLGDGRHRTETRFVLKGGRDLPVYFETGPDVPFLTENLGDLWLPPALLVAMRHGAELRLADPISPGRREDLGIIQDVFTTWFPDRMTKIPIRAPRSVPAAPRSRTARVIARTRPAPKVDRVVGACFTAGLDSFHTFVKNRDRIGALVYGFGLDMPDDDSPFAAQVGGMLRQVADDAGLPLLTARTNVRRVLGLNGVSWGYEGHGSAIAALGTVFAPRLRRLLVPSTHTYREPPPWGSSPLLDHHWSTPRLRFTYDGGEATRVQKTEMLAHVPVVQRNLRVCYSQFETQNCGRCSKCLRTMATLEVLGTLKDFDTFPDTLDLGHIADFDLEGERPAERLRDVLDFAVSRGRDDIAGALRVMLERFDAQVPPASPVGAEETL